MKLLTIQKNGKMFVETLNAENYGKALRVNGNTDYFAESLHGTVYHLLTTRGQTWNMGKDDIVNCIYETVQHKNFPTIRFVEEKNWFLYQ